MATLDVTPANAHRRARGPLGIFTGKKDFSDRWIGHPLANRLGLHLGRIVLADAFDRIRWARYRPLPEDRDAIRALRSEGVVAIPDFLPDAAFARLRAEVLDTIRDSLGRFPPRQADRPGFGDKEPFGGIGFDRFDGGTLNRFVALSPERTPAALALVASERFRRLYAAAQGRDFPASAVSLYYTRHGAETNHDIQKDFHRDTFHFTVKLWYFVADVPAEAGPFVYAPGSNRTTPARLAWEYRRSLVAGGDPSARDGSFRIEPNALRALGGPPARALAVKANTLVIADTHGFHRRGDALPGAERFAIYAGMRRSPYRL